MLEFKHPDMLAGLIVIAFCAMIVLVWTRKRDRAWKLYSIVLPLLAAVLALLAAATPILHFVSPARRVIVALDESPAAITAPWRNLHWLRSFLQMHLPKGTQVELVGFASRPHILTSSLHLKTLPENSARFLPSSTFTASTGSLLEFSGATPCWIFTTGLLRWESSRNDTPPASPIAVTLIPPTQTDVGITNLQIVYLNNRKTLTNAATAPSHESPPSAAPQLAVTLRATGAKSVVARESSAGHILNATPLRFTRSGIKTLLFPPLIKSEQWRDREITVRLTTGDPWPGDGKASIDIPMPGTRHVLIITNHPTNSGHAIPGWITQEIPPAQFSDAIRHLSHVQAVILNDISIGELPADAEKTLEEFVTQVGGGLLIVGTRQAFGPGGYGLPQGHSEQPSVLEQLSPLSSLPPHPRPQHVLFLLDVSGSLGNPTTSGATRFALAARAICGAVQLLKPNDRITVLLFSGRTRQLVNGRAKSVRSILPSLLARIIPNGPTRPNTALPVLRTLLTKKALLVVVTDGRIPHLNVPAWKRLLLRDSVRFAVIAPGHSSTATQQLIAQTGAMRFSMRHFSQWAGLLRAAVARQLGGIEQTNTVQWTSAPLHLKGRTEQWDIVYLKHQATLIARAQTHPLAAVWRRGMGKVAAMAFADSSRQAGILRSSLLNMVRPPAGDHHFDINARYRAAHWTVTVSAVDGKRFMNNLQLGLGIIEQRNRILQTKLKQTAPGKYQVSLPRYIRTFSATFWRLIGHGTNRRRQLLGRIHPPLLPGHYFPATGYVRPCPWPGVAQIPADASATQIWHPRVSHGRFKLAGLLWVMAALTTLAAMVRPWAAKNVSPL